MATTPNYGWTTPDDTDLVKDGALAIRTLGDEIDSTVFANSSTALTLITKQDFSGVSSVSFANGTFTSNYINYLVKFRVKPSTNSYINIRMRASGTDNSTASSYGLQNVKGQSTTSEAERLLLSTWQTSSTNITSSQTANYEINFYSPQVATETGLLIAGGVGNGTILLASGYHTQTVSYDAATFYPNTGTITGSYWVYGLKD